MFSTKSFIIVLLFSVCVSCAVEDVPVELIIHNANVWTANTDAPTAKAFSIREGKILAIGDDEDVLASKSSSTKTIDANGAFVVPGFIDSHVHLMTGGRSLLNVDLRNASSPEEFANKIKDFAKNIDPGDWILEGNWDHTLWGGELPHKDWIDAYTADVPVLVFRLDWHMALANTAALEYAGIDAQTPDVEGGSIGRDVDGKLTGLLKDNAMNLVLDKMPPMTDLQKGKYFEAAVNYFLSNGVTSVHDVDGMNKDFESYSTASKYRLEDKLNVRIYAATPLNEWKQLADAEYIDDHWLKAGCLKGFVDGSLGSHTAAFHDHYSDKEDDKGFFINSNEDLYHWISDVDKADLHVMVHAIGDSANHTLLDIFDRVAEENGPRDRRFRIEHAQHLSEIDIPRFASQGVIASMQPYHAIDDGRWAEDYIGSERAKFAYAINSIASSNGILAFGSDWAVAPASPILGIYAAATRQTLDGLNPEGWIPEQKIGVERALYAYTRDAAYASFDEKIKGTLEVGKLADFVFLSKDLMNIPLEEIKDVEVLKTFVGGKMLYQKEIK